MLSDDEFSSGPDYVTWVIYLLLWSSSLLSYPSSPPPPLLLLLSSSSPLWLFVDIILFLLVFAEQRKSCVWDHTTNRYFAPVSDINYDINCCYFVCVLHCFLFFVAAGSTCSSVTMLHSRALFKPTEQDIWSFSIWCHAAGIKKRVFGLSVLFNKRVIYCWFTEVLQHAAK